MKDGEKAPAVLAGFDMPKPAGDGEENAGALAGKALAKAIKSGDGQAIYDAFESLYHECSASKGSEESEEEEVEE